MFDRVKPYIPWTITLLMCTLALCGSCDKQVSQKGVPIKCFNCNLLFHQRCCIISTYCYKKLIDNNIEWFCEDCNSITFPFSNVTNLELADLFKDNDDQIQPSRKSKCNFCLKKVKQNVSFAHCGSCSCFYHLACMNLKKKDFPLNKNWECSQCTLKTLPFSHVSEEEMLLWFHGLSIADTDSLKNIPSFTIQSLLDELPGQNFTTDDFLSNSIESKYYTPATFLNQKFSKKSFSLIHLNISSLQRHFDELITLLSLLDHSFDIICITETRLHDGDPLTNINMEGYEFVHSPTSSHCGGAGIFIRNTLDYEIIKNLTVSQHNLI